MLRFNDRRHRSDCRLFPSLVWPSKIVIWSKFKVRNVGLQAEGVAGMTLLDVGGGVGAIQLALLQNGVRSVTGVDTSPAYLQAAQQEAERIQYLSDDFVDLSPQLETANIVTLDRVIIFVHPTTAVEDILHRYGFQRRYYDRT
ncbi:MAG: class I SAM-dependent methyltransferase [Chloroflexi bacterium]|nr:class I SAM-dependent methyltransferase [Chloroflexota bacterium]